MWRSILPPSSGRVSSTRLQSDLHPGPGRGDRLPGGRGLSLQVRSPEQNNLLNIEISLDWWNSDGRKKQVCGTEGFEYYKCENERYKYVLKFNLLMFRRELSCHFRCKSQPLSSFICKGEDVFSCLTPDDIITTVLRTKDGSTRLNTNANSYERR